MMFSIKEFVSKCDQIRRKLRIWSHLLNNSLMENFIFCRVIDWLTEYVSKLFSLKKGIDIQKQPQEVFYEKRFS